MQLPQLRAECEDESTQIDKQYEAALLQRADARRVLTDLTEELTALEKRRENLPRGLAELRRSVCEELGLPLDELRFAGELMAVDPDHEQWEASIEMVLRDFALSLLVPDRHYRLVSRYFDRTRLQSNQGKGQRLVYLRVGELRHRNEASVPGSDSLIRKLRFREGHPRRPWVEAHLNERFDYQCCDTIEAFQLASGLAITKERHVKSGKTRHSKDDRDVAVDPARFVLGWDNRDKNRRLAEQISRITKSAERFDQQVNALKKRLDEIASRQSAIGQVDEFVGFDEIDYEPHEAAIAELTLELKRLKAGNQQIQELEAKLGRKEQEKAALENERKQALKHEGQLEGDVKQVEQLVSNARRELEQFAAASIFDEFAECFTQIDQEFAAEPLTTDNLFQQQNEFREQQTHRRDDLQDECNRLLEPLLSQMSKFTTRFPEEKSDLEPRIEYLESFVGMLESIREEDLPRHEERFKEHLNDKVTREIGQLNGQLEIERSAIEDKIELLNVALANLWYRPGTHMQLIPNEVRDHEVESFRQELRGCLDDSFEGSLEADEARFKRIQSLIKRLREEARWRSKVIDVRRWFDFAARELDDETGEERSYYEDSTGQSGGEKAKLAFTILVAAIAYQYDIDPDSETSDRFHFVVVDEMFSKVDDEYAEYALELFRRFGLQLLIVAPLDAKARVTQNYVGHYLIVTKDKDSRSQIHPMSAREFEDRVTAQSEHQSTDTPKLPR